VAGVPPHADDLLFVLLVVLDAVRRSRALSRCPLTLRNSCRHDRSPLPALRSWLLALRRARAHPPSKGDRNSDRFTLARRRRRLAARRRRVHLRRRRGVVVRRRRRRRAARRALLLLLLGRRGHARGAA